MRRTTHSLRGLNPSSYFSIPRRTPLLLGVICALSGCSAAADSPGTSDGPPPLTGGAGGSSEHIDAEIAFEPSAAVALAPLEERAVTVVVSPPAAYTVRFALVDARDAALNESTLVTDVSGRGEVRLTAPSTVGDFSLRAQVGSRSAQLAFTVSARPFAAVEVVPRYSGRRPVTEWVASVHVGPRCADLGPVPRDASRLFARVGADKTALIPKVALGSPIAVAVRAGQFAAGCTEVSPSEGRASFRVEVTVLDRPLALARTELDVALGVGANDPALGAALDTGVAAVREAFLSGESSAATALLDAMDGELKAAARAPFRAARTELAWDTTLSGRNAGLTQLMDAIGSWVTVGRSALLSQRAFEGRLGADPANPTGNPVLHIDRIAELTASDLGVEVTMTGWTADPSDTLAFSGVVTWRHGALVTALARAPAIAGAGVTDVPAALATIADCSGVASSLTAGDAEATVALEAVCGASCLATACRAALATMWQRSAAEGSTASLAVAAAGRATIGNQAQATALDGSWVGKLTLDTKVAETTGSVRGAAPRYTAR